MDSIITCFFSAIFPLPTSRYVVVHGTEVKGGTDRIIGVYDIIKEHYVKFRILVKSVLVLLFYITGTQT